MRMIIALLFAFAWLKPLEDKPPGNDIIYLPNGLGINRYMFIGDAREIRAEKPHLRNDCAHSIERPLSQRGTAYPPLPEVRSGSKTEVVTRSRDFRFAPAVSTGRSNTLS
jgi:hypothetical protein